MDQEKNEKYLNRELSWLKFNERVLNEAKDLENNPLDRIKFLTISASNLDEFDMVRLAGIKTMYERGNTDLDISGMTYEEQYNIISDKTAEFVKDQYNTLDDIMDTLNKDGIVFTTNFSTLSTKQKDFLREYYTHKIAPLISMVFLPEDKNEQVLFYNSIENKALNICLFTEGAIGNIAIPKEISRFVEIPTDGDTKLFTFAENIIEYNLEKEYEEAFSAPYRITRNASYTAETTDINRLMDELEEKLNERRHGNVIKLEVANDAHPDIIKHLKDSFDIDDKSLYTPSRPIDLTVWKDVSKIKPLQKKYKKKEYVPIVPKKFKKVQLDRNKTIFDVISKKDTLLSHPYDSFKPVLDFIEEAANDKNVKSIKQTLYRVSKDSPIIKSLKKAAKNGKEVTVLVELKARFNEEDNIGWAKKLENAGCKVLYGVPGLKVHSKITAVEREEDGVTKYYTHLSTGNYNEVTANIYTDLGLLTADEQIGIDAKEFFNHLENFEYIPEYSDLFVAPEGIKPKFINLINNEIENAKEGKPAYIKAKMNSLCDDDIIDALYLAASEGVKVELLIRGICCLRPMPNLTVKSIVGDYLEHSRIYEFCNNDDPKVFLSSADCMPRNLNRRIEILFPVKDEEIKEKVVHILDCGLNDTKKSYTLENNGDYTKIESDVEFNSQKYFTKNPFKNNKEKDLNKAIQILSKETEPEIEL